MLRAYFEPANIVKRGKRGKTTGVTPSEEVTAKASKRK
jgi:hypothetical protein